MMRANNTCEFDGCDFQHGEYVWAVKLFGKTVGWYRDFDEANQQKKSHELRKNKTNGRLEAVPNPKRVKVVLTIAHLDHDETNYDVQDERLKAACQLCHLRYDAKEKYHRQLRKS
jgi:hypothetical protein